MQNKRRNLSSLRKRAIIFSVAISILIVFISISGYLNFKKVHTESSLNLLKQDELLVRFNLIRSELLDSYKELNNFLLEPENLNYQKSIIVSIKEARRLSQKFNSESWIKKYNKENIVDNLNKQLALLEQKAAKLIHTRLDTNNQFPSLAVGAAIM